MISSGFETGPQRTVTDFGLWFDLDANVTVLPATQSGFSRH
jgi:hypothetical protein